MGVMKADQPFGRLDKRRRESGREEVNPVLLRLRDAVLMRELSCSHTSSNGRCVGRECAARARSRFVASRRRGGLEVWWHHRCIQRRI